MARARRCLRRHGSARTALEGRGLHERPHDAGLVLGGKRRVKFAGSQFDLVAHRALQLRCASGRAALEHGGTGRRNYKTLEKCARVPIRARFGCDPVHSNTHAHMQTSCRQIFIGSDAAAEFDIEGAQQIHRETAWQAAPVGLGILHNSRCSDAQPVAESLNGRWQMAATRRRKGQHGAVPA